MSRFRDAVVSLLCAVLVVYYAMEIHSHWSYTWAKQVTFSNLTTAGTAKPAEVESKWQSAPPELTPPPDHPPLSIVGGEFSYKIHYTTHEWLIANDSSAITVHTGGADGLRGLSHTIWMYKGDPNPRGTLMHELFHVAKTLGDLQNWHFDDAPGQDHEFISPASQELLILMRRNPALVAWLTAEPPIMRE